VNEPDQSVLWASPPDDDALWALQESAATEEPQTVDPMAAFVSLGYIRSALRRSLWFWALLGVLGLLIGSALFVKYPPAYQAETTVLVNDGPNVEPAIAIATDAALVETRTVAGQVVTELHLDQTVSSFLAAVTVTQLTDQLLEITVNAPTAAEATQRTAALAASFLQFHAQYAKTQQTQLESQLNKELAQAQASSNPAKVDTIENYVFNELGTSRTNTNTIVKGSQVVDPAALVKHSRMKDALLYLAGGLIVGLAVGMGIVIIRALVSDRLRRRDDIAAALGAPIRLSVRTVPSGRKPWQASRRNADLRRVVSGLRSTVAGREAPALVAVVAVDNMKDTAKATAALALQCARNGQQVILADLAEGSPAARMLGVRETGVMVGNQEGVRFTVVVPSPLDPAPTGPVRNGALAVDPAIDGESLAEACTTADVMLTLINLDPALGAEHLATWSTEAVAIVTAGRSSTTRIYGVGELIRLAGVRLVSAIVLKADSNDESIGAVGSAAPALAASE
jgi:capsular polysaccharide biosynthesis protein